GLLNLIRPFSNHNGVNSLNFSPETGKLVLTTGDGGSGYDPFNLSQDDLELAGKIIEIDVDQKTKIPNPSPVTRFNELPYSIQETLTVIAKGVRNLPGIAYQKIDQQYIKYVGNVGQEMIESIFSFVNYKPIPVTQITRSAAVNIKLNIEGFINLGWRGWEGEFPTLLVENCPNLPSSDKKTVAYFDEAVPLSVKRLQPLTSYYHEDARSDKFTGNALTGLQVY